MEASNEVMGWQMRVCYRYPGAKADVRRSRGSLCSMCAAPDEIGQTVQRLHLGQTASIQ